MNVGMYKFCVPLFSESKVGCNSLTTVQPNIFLNKIGISEAHFHISIFTN